jgi:hypothetical protein
MKLKKNAGAKVAALLASLTALGGIWALVHQNPPASAETTVNAAPVSQLTPQAAPRGGSNTQPKAPQPKASQPAKKHTRTHVS